MERQIKTTKRDYGIRLGTSGINEGSYEPGIPSKIRSRPTQPSQRPNPLSTTTAGSSGRARPPVRQGRACISPGPNLHRRQWGSTSSLEDISTSMMQVRQMSGSSNLVQIYDNSPSNHAQGSMSDSETYTGDMVQFRNETDEISLTLIEDDSLIDTGTDEDRLSRQFQLGLSTGSQHLHSDESNKISMQDMLELDMFQGVAETQPGQSGVPVTNTGHKRNIEHKPQNIKLDTSDNWIDYRSHPQTYQAVKSTTHKPVMKTITIHTMDNGICQRQTKLVDEAYDDVGSVASIQDSSKVQPFEFILVSPTSPLQKINDESLTYLNQGQAYGLRLKRRPAQIDQLGIAQDEAIRIQLRVTFHDRRLQNTETEQIAAWSKTRPNERFLEIDVALSENITNVSENSKVLNLSEFSWHSSKDAMVFIKVNCISTEFTQKKHGGERGAGFRLQCDCFKEDPQLQTLGYPTSLNLQASSCQIRVFKPRGADRKLKTDHVRVSKQCEGDKKEKAKFSICYDRTRLQEAIPWERRENRQITPVPSKEEYENSLPGSNNCQVMVRQPSLPDISSDFITENMESSLPEYCNGNGQLAETSSIGFVQAWLRRRNFHNFQQKFANYGGADILLLSREDMIQIGQEQPAIHVAECIRLYNAIISPSKLEKKASLLLYIRQPHDDLHYPIFVKSQTVRAFIDCLTLVTNVEPLLIERVINRRKSASTQDDINVMVTDEMVATFKPESSFCIQLIKNDQTEGFTAIIHR